MTFEKFLPGIGLDSRLLRKDILYFKNRTGLACVRPFRSCRNRSKRKLIHLNSSLRNLRNKTKIQRGIKIISAILEYVSQTQPDRQPSLLTFKEERERGIALKSRMYPHSSRVMLGAI